MSPSAVIGKWIAGIFPDTPCLAAARHVIKLRLGAVARLLPLAAQRSDEDPEHVHRLRVATRRTAAALGVFRGFFAEKPYHRIRRHLRGIRRAAAAARRDDVHAVMLAQDAADAGAASRIIHESLLRAIADHRMESQTLILSAASRRSALRSAQRRLFRSLRSNLRVSSSGSAAADPRPFSLARLSLHVLSPLVESLGNVRGDDLRRLDAVHRLRIGVKKLRYAAEIFVECFPAEFKSSLYPRIEELLDRLGRLNDAHEMVLRVEAFSPEVKSAKGARDKAHDGNGLTTIRDGYHRRRDQAHGEFLRWWASPSKRALFAQLSEWLLDPSAPGAATTRRSPRKPGERTPLSNERVDRLDLTPYSELIHRRVAAIDVGTNSIRMVVAQTDPAARFRVIEDMKETTRLGSGLYHTGNLNPDAVQKSLDALRRMKTVADGYQVDRIRAVATSAVREASNRDDFIHLAAVKSGVPLEVIDAEHEARLAFSSVANAFELEGRRAAIIDIGGGSTELVFTSDGVIDAIHKLPLGAVRLTELYGSRREAGGYRFGAMRRAVKKVICRIVERTPYVPDLVIGTGGTFTSMARVSIRRGSTANGVGRFPFAVRGYEVRREEVADLFDWLRRMPLEQRCRVPGLSHQRAEIIVAGLYIVERFMNHLKTERLLVHDGGVRDGLLAEMFDELDFRAESPHRRFSDDLDSVRRFAERSRYEEHHSEHVTRLALSIFDQLAAQASEAARTWSRSEYRHLLQAAGILHDVGLLIGWKRHHQHGYDMILHAELSGFSRREIEMVANVARYHRRRGPNTRHPNFKRLGDDDQRLVAHLVGILRIADGLDRLHTQNVMGVVVRTEPDGVCFQIIAQEEPAVNMKHARRKADVFEAAFHTRTRFVWARKAKQVSLTETAA